MQTCLAQYEGREFPMSCCCWMVFSLMIVDSLFLSPPFLVSGLCGGLDQILTTLLLQEYKFTAEDFLSFLRSIANQSPALSRLFLDKVPAAIPDVDIRDLFEVDDRKVVGRPVPADKKPLTHGPASRAGFDTMCKDSKGADRGDKVEEAVDMTAKLIDRRRKEAKRRQTGSFPGTPAQRVRRYLIHIVRRLGQSIPASEKGALTAFIRDYIERKTTPEEFREQMQTMVDKHALVLPLEYTPEHETRTALAPVDNKRGRPSAPLSGASVAPAAKRARVDPAPAPPLVSAPRPAAHAVAAPAAAPASRSPAGCPACELDMFGDAKGQRACEQCGHAKADAIPAGMSAHRASPSLGEVSSADIEECKLAKFLTEQAREVAPAERNVTVRVVARTEQHTGGGNAPRYPYTMKAMFAFQRLEGKEVAVLGMYVHEFGAEAPEPAAGRVYLECIDSIPLHGPERSEERQKLLTCIVHGYLAFMRSEGYQHLHLRVPPPSAEHSHIFAYRSLSVRLEATLRMAHWYKRLLDGAKSAGLVDGYHSSSHLSRLQEFPPCLLQSSDLAEEHAFSAMRSTVSRLQADCNDRNESSVLSKIIAFKDRFFVADLTPPCNPPPRLQRHNEPVRHCAVVAQRADFTAVCEEHQLSFNSLTEAHKATAWLLNQMVRHESPAEAVVKLEEKPAEPKQPEPVAPVDVKMEEVVHEEGELPAWVQQQQQQLKTEEVTCMRPEDMGKEDLGAWADGDMCGIADAEMFADSLFSM
mmetsp:Transcript_46961/g.111418  ORF Transcript_46961/g.111418 Transcript_46961/m.111418 type:complete len:754 (-) Transcript_46961:261-2522(-)